MLNKNPKDLTLDEINEELEFAGVDRTFQKIEPARELLINLIKKGEIKMTAEAAKQAGITLPKEEKKADLKAAKPAKADKPKKEPKAKKEKPVKEKPVYNFKEEKYNGQRVFVGGTVAHVLGFDPEAKRFNVKLKNGTAKDYPEASVRFKAVDDTYRDKYVHDSGVRTESGSPSIHCGDQIAEAMVGLTQLEVHTLAKENGLEDKYDQYFDAELNAGMIRMNIGNILRAKAKRGEKVTIFSKTPEDAAKIRYAQLMEERKKAEAEKAEKAKARAEAKKAADVKKKEAAQAKAAKAAEAKAKAADKKAAKAAPKKAAK